MALRSEMRDDVGPELCDRSAHRVRVADAALDEVVTIGVCNLGHRRGTAGIGQLVEAEHFVVLSPMRCRTSAEPMNPAPPVTKMRMCRVLQANGSSGRPS